MWKAFSVILLCLGLCVCIAMTFAQDAQPTARPPYIDMTPTAISFQTTTTQDTIAAIQRVGPWTGGQALFESNYLTDESLPDVMSAYESAFDSDGWELRQRIIYWGSGTTRKTMVMQSFCRLNGDATLSVFITEPEDTDALLKVAVYVDVPSPFYTCPDIEINSLTVSTNQIPDLKLPNDVRSLPIGDRSASWVRSEYKDRDLLESTRPLADIAADYHAQMMAAGWQLLAQQDSSTAVMSTWTLTDADGIVWTGMMAFVADQAPNRYLFFISIDENPFEQ